MSSFSPKRLWIPFTKPASAVHGNDHFLLQWQDRETTTFVYLWAYARLNTQENQHDNYRKLSSNSNLNNIIIGIRLFAVKQHLFNRRTLYFKKSHRKKRGVLWTLQQKSHGSLKKILRFSIDRWVWGSKYTTFDLCIIFKVQSSYVFPLYAIFRIKLKLYYSIKC